jgi:selenocysteine-specific elongation factor
LVKLEVRDLVKGSFLENAPLVPVSARSGQGLDELRRALANVAKQVTSHPQDRAARLPIDRAFSMQGFGTVVTGTLVAGRIAVEDELALVPGDMRVRVRGVQVHGRKREHAVAGERTALNLSGIEVGDVVRGQMLAAPDTLTITRRLDATIDVLGSAKRVKHGARVRFHHGTSEVLGRVSIASPAAQEIMPGTGAAVRMRLESPVAITRGDRFVLRAYSPAITIAGGEVLDPDPPRSGVRTSAAVQRFETLAVRPGQGVDHAVQRMVHDTGAVGLALDQLVRRVGVAPGDLPQVIKRVEESGAMRVATDRLVSGAVLKERSERLLTLVADFHKAQPLADGVPREEARERLFARAHPHVFALVLHELEKDNRLVVRDRLALPGHRLELTPDETRARTAIEAAYKQGRLNPPDAATLAADKRLPPALVERMTSLLMRQKVLVRVDTLVFHVEALQDLRKDIQALKTSAPGGRATVDVATFKDRYGMTRKFAIPLLEWLDRERVTRRVGDTRIVL